MVLRSVTQAHASISGSRRVRKPRNKEAQGTRHAFNCVRRDYILSIQRCMSSLCVWADLGTSWALLGHCLGFTSCLRLIDALPFVAQALRPFPIRYRWTSLCDVLPSGCSFPGLRLSPVLAALSRRLNIAPPPMRDDEMPCSIEVEASAHTTAAEEVHDRVARGICA